MGLGISAPFAHAMRIVSGILFYRLWRPTVRVPFPQNGVYGTSFYFVISCLYGFFIFIFRLIRIIGHSIAKFLKLLNSSLHLGHRSADIGKLDDICFGRFGDFPKLGQVIADPLVFLEVFGKRRQDPARQGDVAGFHDHPCGIRKSIDNG